MSDDTLRQFAAEFDRCWLCGTKAGNTWPPRLEIHHIVRGPGRERARGERCALIRTCPPCHRNLLDSMPVARQLAIKRVYDAAGYNREAVNLLRNRAADAISEGEVLSEVYELQAISGVDGYYFPRFNFRS